MHVTLFNNRIVVTAAAVVAMTIAFMTCSVCIPEFPDSRGVAWAQGLSSEQIRLWIKANPRITFSRIMWNQSSAEGKM